VGGRRAGGGVGWEVDKKTFHSALLARNQP